jgi:hypothetical protein
MTGNALVQSSGALNSPQTFFRFPTFLSFQQLLSTQPSLPHSDNSTMCR